MTAVGIIPARYEAIRFPGKLLCKIAGRPMIQHVWEGACRAKSLRTVLVATDDERIADVCRDFGAEVVLTRSDHETGTDRLAEAAASLVDDFIVNIQGDEPLIEGFVVDAAVEALSDAPEASMSTVVHAAGPACLEDPNRVKVVLDHSGDALYFSRSAIPHGRDGRTPERIWQHVGLYVYRRAFLQEFVQLAPSLLERSEALEQLRALENGHRIRCVKVEGWESVPVDVPEDLARVEVRLAARAS